MGEDLHQKATVDPKRTAYSHDCISGDLRSR